MGFDFSFTQEQEEIRKLAHEFAVNEMRPVAADYDEKEETPWAVMQKAHDLGLDAASGFPEAVRGRRHRPDELADPHRAARLG